MQKQFLRASDFNFSTGGTWAHDDTTNGMLCSIGNNTYTATMYFAPPADLRQGSRIQKIYVPYLIGTADFDADITAALTYIDDTPTYDAVGTPTDRTTASIATTVTGGDKKYNAKEQCAVITVDSPVWDNIQASAGADTPLRSYKLVLTLNGAATSTISLGNPTVLYDAIA